MEHHDEQQKFCQEKKLNWLYIDINSYFATIEQQLDSTLRNKPIAVVPSASDSTCAIAASYEAKLKGVQTGTKIYEAKKLCLDLICINARHKVYAEYHHKIFQEINKYLKVDHIFSIDEGACRLTGKYCNAEEAVLIAKQIKTAIKNNVGDYIVCSIGISSNRYLAKIATNFQKVDGLVVIRPSELPEKLYGLRLTDMPGIGAKTYARLLNSGISTVQDLCAQDKAALCNKWGSINGEKIWHLIRGKDLPVEEAKKSIIGHSQVLSPELRTIDNARNALLYLVLRAASRLRAKELYTNRIVLTIETTSKEIINSRVKIELSCDDKSLVHSVMKCWDGIIKKKRITKVKKIGVSLHGLCSQPHQLSFDAFLLKNKQETLSRMLDDLNIRLGDNTVRQGLLLKKHKSAEVIAFGYVPQNSNNKD